MGNCCPDRRILVGGVADNANKIVSDEVCGTFCIDCEPSGAEGNDFPNPFVAWEALETDEGFNVGRVSGTVTVNYQDGCAYPLAVRVYYNDEDFYIGDEGSD